MDPMNENPLATTPSRAAPGTLLSRIIAPAMWISAGIMLGLIFFKSDSISGAPPFSPRLDSARAGGISTAGGYTLLTSSASNEDLFLVLDGRSESLLVYRVENNKDATLYQKVPLSQIFMEGRVRAGFGGR
jgi:hypothetical protein